MLKSRVYKTRVSTLLPYKKLLIFLGGLQFRPARWGGCGSEIPYGSDFRKLIPPRNGQHEQSTQHEGVFEIVGINTFMQTSNIRLADGSGRVIPNVPWASLKALDKK